MVSAVPSVVPYRYATQCDKDDRVQLYISQQNA